MGAGHEKKMRAHERERGRQADGAAAKAACVFEKMRQSCGVSTASACNLFVPAEKRCGRPSSGKSWRREKKREEKKTSPLLTPSTTRRLFSTEFCSVVVLFGGRRASSEGGLLKKIETSH